MCEHRDFEADVTFNRFTPDDGGPGFTLTADFHARCRACGRPIVWITPHVGLASDRPTSSPDGQELRVPCFVRPGRRP